MKKKSNKEKVEIRKFARNTYILILVAIIVISLVTLYNSFNAENKSDFIKTNVYEYNNKFSYSYDVNMFENKYISKENIADGNAYITELIDVVPINMEYSYKANQNSDIIYSYQVTGKLEATYSKDGTEQKIWKKTEVLVPMKEQTASSDNIQINENLDLNLKEKIQMVKDFQQELSMQVETKYTILLEVVTRTRILGKEVVNVYSPDIVFEIGPKTTTIKSNTEKTERPQVVTRMVPKTEGSSQIRAGIATGTMVLSVVLLIVILFKTKNSNVVRNEYKVELNKILKGCEEKIVEVNSRVETDGNPVVDVKEFEEIIKVSEELFKPIIYWNNDREEESWFCVVGNNMVYRYILKR